MWCFRRSSETQPAALEYATCRMLAFEGRESRQALLKLFQLLRESAGDGLRLCEIIRCHDFRPGVSWGERSRDVLSVAQASSLGNQT